jgi:hypothetical protein
MLSSTTLYNELFDKITLFTTVADAIQGWATAFDNYWIEAETNGIPVSPGSTVAAKAAMAGAMGTLNDPGAGAAAIVSGITEYWLALNIAPATIFAACTGIVSPSGLASLQTALQTVFTSNITAASTKEVSLNAVAGVIHTANIGPTPGQATFPGPVTFPIT